jgi:SPP1 family predicted phage head-tail adaptor
MNPGILSKTVTFQALSPTVDSVGQPTEIWTDFAIVRAGINTLRGREFIQALAGQSELTHIVTIRYIVGLNPTMRIKYCDRYFQVSYIINVDEKNREQQIYCTEVYNVV